MSHNHFVNKFAQYIYQWRNPPCYKYGILQHISPEHNSTTQLSQAESSHLRNLYQRSLLTRKFNLPIPAQAYNGQEPIWDRQQANHNLGIVYSNFVTAESMRSFIKWQLKLFNTVGIQSQITIIKIYNLSTLIYLVIS